jgi:paraquat-inducible protein A
MRRFQPWSMMEVFMLGVLVTIVKLAKMALIVPGPAVYCFMALILVLASCTATLDPHQVWERWEGRCP